MNFFPAPRLILNVMGSLFNQSGYIFHFNNFAVTKMFVNHIGKLVLIFCNIPQHTGVFMKLVETSQFAVSYQLEKGALILNQENADFSTARIFI